MRVLSRPDAAAAKQLPGLRVVMWSRIAFMRRTSPWSQGSPTTVAMLPDAVEGDWPQRRMWRSRFARTAKAGRAFPLGEISAESQLALRPFQWNTYTRWMRGLRRTSLVKM
jgi:hypothetical protein